MITIFLYRMYIIHNTEGFTDSNKKATLNPDAVSYQLLTTVMAPIRRLSTIILNPANWAERISMASMTPTELARMHLQSQQNTI